jgi:hypothetical protein
MKIGRVEQQQINYRVEQVRLQDRRLEDYTKAVERKKFDRTVAERVQRNIRLGLDKGTHVDVEC